MSAKPVEDWLVATGYSVLCVSLALKFVDQAMSTSKNRPATRETWERVTETPSDEDLGYPPREDRDSVGAIEITNNAGGVDATIYDRENADAWLQSTVSIDMDDDPPV